MKSVLYPRFTNTAPAAPGKVSAHPANGTGQSIGAVFADNGSKHAPGPAIDSAEFRSTLSRYPTGVSVITAMTGEGPVGMAVGSFTSISLDPPLVGFFVDKASGTLPKIITSGSFCVNVLGSEHRDRCRQFASKAEDRFADTAWTAAGSGSPMLDSSVAWIDCNVVQVLAVGDHQLVVGGVRGLKASETPAEPLLFHRGSYGFPTPM